MACLVPARNTEGASASNAFDFACVRCHIISDPVKKEKLKTMWLDYQTHEATK